MSQHESDSSPNILPATFASFREMKKELGVDEFISVKVTSPHRVGNGVVSYLAYTVTTATNLSYFTKKNPIVSRRFSDFLGLRNKLCERYLHLGHIIPPAPDKSVVGMTKAKITPEEEATHSESVERRRASLERFLIRTADHPQLRLDPDFWEFLELDAVLPKSNETSVVSGKNMMRIVKAVGDRLYTVRMEENDVWFEEKTALLINLDTELQKLSVVTERLVDCRKKLSRKCLSLSRKLTVLGNTENNRNLATALASLARLEEDVGQIQGLQAKDDLFLVSELVCDYIGVVRSVKEVLGERVKAWHSWQTVLRELDKRKEAKRKAEVAGNQDRINTLRQEIAELERQVNKEEGNFQKISRTIKLEFDIFDMKKVGEFQQRILQYIEHRVNTQGSLVTLWESIIPVIQQIGS